MEFVDISISQLSISRLNQTPYLPLSRVIEKSIDRLEEWQYNESTFRGVMSGFLSIDRLCSGFHNSDLIIIAARPLMGKTSLAVNIVRNAAGNEGVPAIFFSLKVSDEQLGLQMLCSEAGLELSRIKDGLVKQDDWIRILKAAGVLSRLPISIVDASDNGLVGIKSKARMLKRNKGLGLIIIDNLQLIKSRDYRKQSAERQDFDVGEISRSLKALAKELNVPVIALFQLDSMLEQREDKRPQLSDLSEAGTLEQDADIVAFIYRDAVYNNNKDNPDTGIAEITVAKNRHGQTGVAHLLFQEAYSRFEDLA